MTTKLNLAQKIAAASNAVGALETDKHNPQGNYKYISADKILERAGNALADAGVAVVPGISHVEVNTGTTSGNKPRFDVSVYMKMIVTDGETTIEQPWLGMGSDYSVPDKAMYKAITSGHKYFLAKLLNVGVGNEDSDHEPAQEPAPVAARTNGHAKPPVQKPAQTPVSERHPFEEDEATLRERMVELGKDFYGDSWDEGESERLCLYVSTGSVSDTNDLKLSEVELLIKGLEKNIAARKAKQPQPA